MSKTHPRRGTEPVRALVYARYSTSLQSGASIEDQVRICRERADREGWEVAGVFTDAAISGAVRARPGLNQLLELVGRRGFDVVLAESIDRVSRDLEDMAAIFKRIRFAGARLITLSEGEIGDLHVGLKGTMSALYRTDLADKVRRGQTGRVLAGRCPGGNAYGYRRVAQFDEHGEPIKGLRAIDPDQATIVRRIYAEFLDGRSPRDIASRLNAESIPGPTGGPWSASTINGDRVRKNGILQNELYRGVLVFNRTRKSYTPDTRLKRIRPTAPESWTVMPAPELRIIDDATWEAVSARRARFDGTRIEQQRRPQRLLSGLVKCGVCGGNYVLIGPEKWGCSNHRQRGTCPSGRTIQSHMLRRRVFACLRRELLDPEAVRVFVMEYHRGAQERAAEEARDRRKLDKRRAKAQRDVDRLVRAVTEGGSEFAEIRTALERARAELASIDQEVESLSAGAVIALHPGIAEDYRRNVDALLELLDGRDEDEAQREAKRAFRALINSVVVTPAESGPGTAVTLEARLQALLDLAAGRAVTEAGVCQRWCPGWDSNADIRRLSRGRC